MNWNTTTATLVLTVMKRSLAVWLLALLTLLCALAEARGRSGGGFGGSRSYRTPHRAPSYRAPNPTFPNRLNRPQPRVLPRSTVRPLNPAARTNFFFVPFFGLNPLGLFGMGSGAGWGLLGLLFNLILVAALAGFLLWLVRRR